VFFAVFSRYILLPSG